MKLQGWDNFLQQVAKDHQLRGRLKEVFLVRFAYENWRKPDKQIWRLAEAASHETYKKQMTSVYASFTQADATHEHCPELEVYGRGPGKFNILREWLQETQYPKWQQSSTLPTAASDATFSYRMPVASDSPFYIERPPVEADCYQQTLQPGALIRIRAPEKMGKTSLLRRILAHAQSRGCQPVYLNLREAESSLFTTLDKFLRWFCANMSRELGLQPLLEEDWSEELYGSLISCKTYVQTQILSQLDRPLVLGLDNVDRVFEFPEIAQDFLPMLRSWNEEANNQAIWENLRLVIAHATEIYIELDANQSPFNVGWPVSLIGFSVGQMQQLAQVWGQNCSIQQIEALHSMVGGHPYLVQIALDALQQMPFDQLLEQASTQGGIYSHHLRAYGDTLHRQPELAIAMKQVIESQAGVQLEPWQIYQLESMGLVTLEGDVVWPSCELYRSYFSDYL
ncbi:MAG: AAA-like domain-containing protein [Thermosynechococcaceae cyanobacterium]